MKKNKKGFTLIELLAIIIILAIIALIATPIVFNIIKATKKGVFKISAEKVLEATKLYYSSNLLQPTEPENIIFNCYNNECISNEKDENNDSIKLDIEGNVGKGSISIKKDGNISFSLTNNEYCAVKYEDKRGIEVTNGDCSNIGLINDTTKPVIETVSTIATINSIQIVVSAKDEESGIYGYQYSIDNGTTYTEIQRNNMYIFDGLTNDKEYEVKVKVYNGTYGQDTFSEEKGMSESETKIVKLKAVDTPIFTITPEEWSTEKEVSIEYKGAKIKEYSLDNGNTFIEYKEPFKVTENITIIAKASNGNEDETNTIIINKVDIEKPIVEVNDINTKYEQQDEITLILSDNLSGVTHYCVTNEAISDNCNWISGNGIIKYTIGTNGVYNAYSKDLVGNISEKNEFIISKIDTEKPEAYLEVTDKTPTSITVKATCSDNVGIAKYEYSKDNGVSYETGISDTYTFENLATGIYNMKVICSDEAGNSNIGNVVDSTSDLALPEYIVSNAGIWASSKMVTISYPNEEYVNEYKIISGSATKEDGTELAVDTWYRASNKKEKLIFTSNGNIVATSTDEANNVTSQTKNISMIETDIPLDMTLSINSDETYSKTKSVTVTLKDTGGSGLAEGSIKYGWSTSIDLEPSNYEIVSTSKTIDTNETTFTATGSGITGSYYLWVVPVIYEDNAGNSNTTTVKSTGVFNFDNNGPTISLGTVTSTINTITISISSMTDNQSSSVTNVRCTAGTGSSYTGYTGTISGNTCTISGLNSATEYNYRVYADDELGNIGYSDGSISTLASITGTPTIAASWPSTSQIKVNISGMSIDSSDSVEYRYLLGSTVKQDWTTANSYTYTGLSGGTGYSIKVETRAQSSQTEGNSKTATIYTSKTVSKYYDGYSTRSSCENDYWYVTPSPSSVYGTSSVRVSGASCSSYKETETLSYDCSTSKDNGTSSSCSSTAYCSTSGASGYVSYSSRDSEPVYSTCSTSKNNGTSSSCSSTASCTVSGKTGTVSYTSRDSEPVYSTCSTSKNNGTSSSCSSTASCTVSGKTGTVSYTDKTSSTSYSYYTSKTGSGSTFSAYSPDFSKTCNASTVGTVTKRVTYNHESNCDTCWYEYYDYTCYRKSTTNYTCNYSGEVQTGTNYTCNYSGDVKTGTNYTCNYSGDVKTGTNYTCNYEGTVEKDVSRTYYSGTFYGTAYPTQTTY